MDCMATAIGNGCSAGFNGNHHDLTNEIFGFNETEWQCDVGGSDLLKSNIHYSS